MKTVFADSFYFFALANPNDASHAKSHAFTNGYTGRLVTTGWILSEVGDGWAKPARHRPYLSQLNAELLTNPMVQLVPCTDQLLRDGIRFYDQHADKEWSLTDCISFMVMRREGITEALTGDRHFEQAGFIALLK